MFALMLVIIMLIVPLSSEISSIEEFNDPEMGNIETLEFSSHPDISDKLQSTIDATMSGFQIGFRENPNSGGEQRFLLSGSQMDMQFSESMIQFRFPYYDKAKKISAADSLDQANSLGPELVGYSVVSLEFVGSNPVEPLAGEPSASYYNYFYGSDPEKWITNAPYYATLKYKDIYDNIDLIYTINNGQLKYDFFVYPGGNYEDIQFRWEGPVSLNQVHDGLQITVSSPIGERSFIDSNPVNFLETRQTEIIGNFRIIDEVTYGFSIDNYDCSETLIIDPLIKFSTFLGGTSHDYGRSIAVDDSGDVYVTGYTHSTDFPTSPDTYDDTHNGDKDVFVSKLSANGSTLIYSTFLGGSGEDLGYSIAVDGAAIYITGATLDHTTDFPTTPGAYDETHNGGIDTFVSKLAANGSTLLFSTFLGGSSHDPAYSIAVDGDDIYITGYTFDDTTDFPTTPGASNETHNGGGTDAFVSKLSANGSTLLYSTFLGGSVGDSGYSIAIQEGGVYITGATTSTDFPSSTGAYGDTHNGDEDVFVSKLSSDLSILIYSTYLGGSGSDVVKSIAVDDSGIYITGYTREDTTDFPTTPGAYDETHNGGDDDFMGGSDAFVSKLSSDLSTLLYSTFLGGPGDDIGYSIAVDDSGIYITGQTFFDLGYPTTTGAYDEIYNGGDAIVSKLAANFSTLIYSTYLGGSGSDTGYSIAVDNGYIYITGDTSSTDYPCTAGAFDETHNVGADVFVSKLRLRPDIPSNFKLTVQNKEKGNYIILFWDAPNSGAFPSIKYNIYRGTSTGDYIYLTNVQVPQSYYNDTSVIENQDYYYAVTAVNVFGEGDYSSEVYAEISSEPAAPQNLLATEGEGFVELSWDLPVDDGGLAITEYRIYCGTSSGSYSIVFVSTLLEFNDTSVASNTIYYYVVTAVNDVGESEYSSEVSVATPDVIIPTETDTITDTVFDTITDIISTTITEFPTEIPTDITNTTDTPIFFTFVILGLVVFVFRRRP